MLWDCSSLHLWSVPEPGNSRLTVTGSSLHPLTGVACTGTLCPSVSVGTASLCLPDVFFLLPENPSGAGTRLPTRCALSLRTCTAPLVTCCEMWMPSPLFVPTSSLSLAMWCPTSIYPKPWKSTSRCWKSECLPGVLTLRAVAL